MLEEVTWVRTSLVGAGGGQGQCGCGRERSPEPKEAGVSGSACPLAATSRKDRGSPVVLGALRPIRRGLVGLHLVWRPCPASRTSLTWAPAGSCPGPSGR